MKSKKNAAHDVHRSPVRDVYRSTTPNPEKLLATSYIDPTRNFYQENDFQISQRNEIQETYDQLYEISETTTGDWDAKDIAAQYNINKYTYIINGAYAFKTRMNGSYKKYSLDFKSFCKDYLGRSYSTVHREIIGSRVATDLILMGFDVLPSCTSQTELLKDLYGEELYDVWKKITDEYRQDQITTTVIRSVLKKDHEPIEDEPVKVNVSLPRKLYHEIMELAIDLEKSIVDTINFLYHEVYLYHTSPKSSNPGTEVLSEWAKDLQDIVYQFQIAICGEPRIIQIE